MNTNTYTNTNYFTCPTDFIGAATVQMRAQKTAIPSLFQFLFPCLDFFTNTNTNDKQVVKRLCEKCYAINISILYKYNTNAI